MEKMMKGVVGAIFLISFCLNFSAQDLDNTLEYIEKQDSGRVEMNWTKKVLRVKGYGFGPKNIQSLGQRKLLARRAALVEAYRNTLESVKGIQVTSTTTVKNLMLESDNIKTRTEGMVRGAKILAINYRKDGSCEVTLEVNIGKNGVFLLENLDDTNVTVVDNYPKFDWLTLKKKLEKAEKELITTKKKLNSTQMSLAKSMDNLEQTRVKLKKEELENQDLEDIVNNVKKELDLTKQHITEMNQQIKKSPDLNANPNKVKITSQFLDEKRAFLNFIKSEINQPETRPQTVISQNKLSGYVAQIQTVQRDVHKKYNNLIMDQKNHVEKKDKFSGILIDARGKGVKPVLAPCILIGEKKQLLYGPGSNNKNTPSAIDYLTGNIDKAINYSTIAKNPLVVKAEKTINGSDIVIEEADLSKLAKLKGLFEMGKVAVLL